MINKKYELTNETKKLRSGVILHRIRSLVDFDDVKEGDLGGFIEEEHNLDQNGCSWVYDDSQVYNKARVLYNAKVYDSSVVNDRSILTGHVIVKQSCITDQSFLEDSVSIESSKLYNVRAQDYAQIIGSVVISVYLTDNSVIKYTQVIKGFLESNATIALGKHSDHLPTLDLQKRRLGCDAYIKNDEDIINIDAGGLYTVTIYKTKNNGISLYTGATTEEYFEGKLPEYIRWVINNELMENKQKKKFIKIILSAVDLIK